MADLKTLVERMREDGQFITIARNPGAQFGSKNKRYLGAELLPEKEVPQNEYRETDVRYQTVIANDGTRYSPSQKKDGKIVGSFLVELGNSDIARDISGRDYDALVEYANQDRNDDLEDNLAEFADTTINKALVEHDEKQRWDAIISAQVVRAGDNGYTETVDYSNPAGHRINASDAWSDDAFDPLEEDIIPLANMLKGKGFTINRIVTSTTVRSKLLRNAKVRQAVLGTTTAAGSITARQLNDYLADQELPPIETYDLQYKKQAAGGLQSSYYLARNVFVMVCTTERDMTVDLGVDEKLLENTLGYQAIGRASGQAEPGRVIRAEGKEDKPPRVEAEGWQTSLPVILEPEAIGVIGSIT